MNREEILAKSRRENVDEGLVMVENQGRKIGITVMTSIFSFIALFDFFFAGESNHAAYGLYWAFISAQSYPKYRFTQKIGYLFVTIAGAVICSICLLRYIFKVLG